MSATIDNLLPKSPARYGNESAPIPAEWYYARERIASRQNAQDIGDVCAEASVQILDAIRKNDPDLIGRVILAARNANLDRRADRVCCIDPDEDPVNRPTEDIAALRVLLAASVGRVS